VQDIYTCSTAKVDLLKSGIVNRTEKIANKLNFTPVCTLPIKESKEIIPSSISIFDNDGADNSSESLISQDSVNYELLRHQNDKVGIVKPSNIKPGHEGVSYQITPEISGTIFGYFADTIFLVVEKLEHDNSGLISKILLKASTNGMDWSSAFEAFPNQRAKILIEDDIEIGLSVRLQDESGLDEGDKWDIGVFNTTLASPALNISLEFDSIENISFLQFVDVSEYKLKFTGSRLDKSKFSSEVSSESYLYDGRIGQILVTQDSINNVKLEFEQKDYNLYESDGALKHKFDFKILDIKGFIQTYERFGSLVFNPLFVNGITTITTDAEEFTPKYKAHTSSEPSVPLVFTEYSLLLESDTDKVIIPTLPKDYFKSKFKGVVNSISDLDNITAKHLDLAVVNEDKTYVFDELDGWKIFTNDYQLFPTVFEYVVPIRINEQIDYNPVGDIYTEDPNYGLAEYRTRFPIAAYKAYNDQAGGAFNIVDMVPGVAAIDIHNNRIDIANYVNNKPHAIHYAVKTYKVSDTINSVVSNKWTKVSSNIFYMYYLDESYEFHVALRKLDRFGTLTPFSGKVSGLVEMRSADSPYKTPILFSYSLACI